MTDTNKKGQWAAPTGDAARLVAYKMGPANEQQLRNIATYLATNPDFVYGQVTAEQLRLLADKIEGGDTAPFGSYDAAYVETLHRTISDLAKQVEDVQAGSGKKDPVSVSMILVADGKDLDPQAIGAELGLELAMMLDELKEENEPVVPVDTRSPFEILFADLAAKDDIAGFLQQEGIKGRRSNAFTCPVSRYLERELGQSVSTSQDGSAWVRDGGVPTVRDIRVGRFVTDFDLGKHPELDEQYVAPDTRTPLQIVVDKLAAQADVAAFLKEQGIKGRKALSASCPVSNYVKRELATPFAVRSYYGIVLEDASTHIIDRVSTPENVFTFIEDFDNGLFPELDGSYVPPKTLENYVPPKTLESVLEDLAAKPDIASFLEAEGIKGSRTLACDCPVARYATRELGFKVWAFQSYSQNGPLFASDVRVNNPAAIKQFIRAFDDGQFPGLDENSPKNLLEKAINELAAKGDADQIAAYLRSEGINFSCPAFDSKSRTEVCPVAQYLQRSVGSARASWAYAYTYTFGTGEENKVEYPKSVRAFIRNFDNGLYPVLNA